MWKLDFDTKCRERGNCRKTSKNSEDRDSRMTTPGRGQVWTSEQLTARLTALRGLVPAVVQHVVYRATIDASAYAHEGYVVPGEARRLTAAAFDFWLAKRGLAGPGEAVRRGPGDPRTPRA